MALSQTADNSESLQNQYRRLGYLRMGKVAEPEVSYKLRTRAAQLATTLPSNYVTLGDDGRPRVVLHVCHRDKEFRRFVTQTEILDQVQSVVGFEPTVLTSLVFWKAANGGEALEPHQDLPYYPYLKPGELVTLWVALTDVSRENGPLEYNPGSHAYQARHGFGTKQALSIQTSANTDWDRVELSRGEAVLHDGLTIHRSAQNTSDGDRVGIAILFIPIDVQYSSQDFPFRALSRGEV